MHAQKNRLYTSDYPASEQMKLSSAWLTYTQAVLYVSVKVFYIESIFHHMPLIQQLRVVFSSCLYPFLLKQRHWQVTLMAAAH